MAQINWSRNKQMGISTNGWIVRERTYDNSGWDVFDADDNFIGRFQNRADAVKAAR